jgi:hypothetical protein
MCHYMPCRTDCFGACVGRGEGGEGGPTRRACATTCPATPTASVRVWEGGRVGRLLRCVWVCVSELVRSSLPAACKTAVVHPSARRPRQLRGGQVSLRGRLGRHLLQPPAGLRGPGRAAAQQDLLGQRALRGGQPNCRAAAAAPSLTVGWRPAAAAGTQPRGDCAGRGLRVSAWLQRRGWDALHTRTANHAPLHPVTIGGAGWTGARHAGLGRDRCGWQLEIAASVGTHDHRPPPSPPPPRPSRAVLLVVLFVVAVGGRRVCATLRGVVSTHASSAGTAARGEGRRRNASPPSTAASSPRASSPQSPEPRKSGGTARRDGRIAVPTRDPDDEGEGGGGGSDSENDIGLGQQRGGGAGGGGGWGTSARGRL